MSDSEVNVKRSVESSSFEAGLKSARDGLQDLGAEARDAGEEACKAGDGIEDLGDDARVGHGLALFDALGGRLGDQDAHQAGLQGFEATCEDLARAFEQAESSRTAPEGVQTSAAPPPALAPEPSSGATADTPETAEPPPTVHLRLVLSESVDRLLQAAEARLRQDADETLTPEECLHLLCLVFLRQAGQEDSGVRAGSAVRPWSGPAIAGSETRAA